MPSWNVDGISGGLAPQEPHAAPASASETAPMLRGSLERSASKRISFTQRGQEDDDIEPGDLFTSVDNSANKKRQWIILPQSEFRKLWVRITLVVAFYIIWVTPVRVGFNMQAQGPWFWIEGIIDIFFYIDLVLNFFTAYEHPATSELITDHKRIAKRYLRSWFWIDVLATFPSDYIIKGMQGTWGCSFWDNCDPSQAQTTAATIVLLLRMTRVFRIIWIFKNFSVLSVYTIIGKWMDEFITVRWLISIGELVIVLMFLGHLCGSFFYMFSHPAWQTPVERELIDQGQMSTWVLDKTGGYEVVEMPTRVLNVSNQTAPTNTMAQDPATGNWYMCPDLYFIFRCTTCKGMQLRCRAELGFTFRYITAMYWAYTTMTTVGYGDIYATTVAEKVWAMCTMVVGGFFLSFCFGRIASIVGRLDAVRAARAEQIESITQFLKDHELPKPLSRKVLDFFKTNVKSVRQYDRAQVLARMPFDLRSTILQHMYDTCIKNIPTLYKLCTHDVSFMPDFTIRLHPYHTSADTYVYHKGEHSSDLFILIRGDVYVMDDRDSQTKLVKVPEGSIFGEEGVISHLNGQPRNKREENVKCETNCDMLRLPIDDAVELCDMYPELAKALKRLFKARKQQLIQVGIGLGGTQLPPPYPGASPRAASTIAAVPAHSDASVTSHTGADTPPATHHVDVSSALKDLYTELQGEVRALKHEQEQQRAVLERLPAAVAAQLASSSSNGGAGGLVGIVSHTSVGGGGDTGRSSPRPWRPAGRASSGQLHY